MSCRYNRGMIIVFKCGRAKVNQNDLRVMQYFHRTALYRLTVSPSAFFFTFFPQVLPLCEEQEHCHIRDFLRGCFLV